MKPTCPTGHVIPSGDRFCGKCGQPRSDRERNDSNDVVIMGPNSGTVAGRDIGTVINNPTSENNDPYVRTEGARLSTRKSILPDNWVTALSGVCAIVTFAITMAGKNLPDEWGLVIPILTIVGIVVFALSVYVRLMGRGDRLLIPLSDGACYEKSMSGNVFRTRPALKCPFCDSNGQDRWMFLQRARDSGGIFWTCVKNPVQHKLEYDPVAFPEFEG
jgi:hypothetical protein